MRQAPILGPGHAGENLPSWSQTLAMPSLSQYFSEPVTLTTSDVSPYDPPHRASTEKTTHPVSDAKSALLDGRSKDSTKDGKVVEEVFLSESDGVNSNLQSLPNGRTSDSTDSRGKTQSRDGSIYSKVNGNGGIVENEKAPFEVKAASSKSTTSNTVASPPLNRADVAQHPRPKSPENGQFGKRHHKGHARAHSSSAPPTHDTQPKYLNNVEASPTSSQAHLTPQDAPQASKNRFSSPPVLPNVNQTAAGSSAASLHPVAPRLHHRHTLEVPRISTSRTSRDLSYPGTASEANESGRFSPTPRTPRASTNLVRAPTRSIHSDMYLDDVPADSDIAKWTEAVRQKRASRRKRKEEEEDDRVVVGTKVDMNHVNWVTAYNMLTGIRFTVSRTNAKMDRELTDADFDAKNKFSFDM